MAVSKALSEAKKRGMMIDGPGNQTPYQWYDKDDKEIIDK